MGFRYALPSLGGDGIGTVQLMAMAMVQGLSLTLGGFGVVSSLWSRSGIEREWALPVDREVLLID